MTWIMSMQAVRPTAALSGFEQLRLAREILCAEGQALLGLADTLGDTFCRALKILHACEGCVIVSGMGKAGLVGQKIAATMASTGTRSHFLHPGEAIHGDLGRVHRDDVVLMLSFSGETEEITRLLPSLREIAIVAITGRPASSLGRAASVTLDLGPLEEACTLGLAPSTSTTAMLALGDALALVLSRMQNFGPHDFVRFHPGGSLGRKLAKVEEVMRPLNQCRVATEDRTVRDVFVDVRRPGRRSGAVMLMDSHGRLTGIFTDSDLAKLLESRQDASFDEPVHRRMTRSPATVARGTRMGEALRMIAERKISELPVIDGDGRPVGMIDITDIVSWLPQTHAAEIPSEDPDLSSGSEDSPILPFPA
jgi:arabinose-5-phosphate isomerase